MKVLSKTIKYITVLVVLELFIVLVIRNTLRPFVDLSVLSRLLPDEQFVILNVSLVLVLSFIARRLNSKKIVWFWDKEFPELLSMVAISLVFGKYVSVAYYPFGNISRIFIWAIFVLLSLLVLPSAIDFFESQINENKKIYKSEKFKINIITLFIILVIVFIHFRVASTQAEKRDQDGYSISHPKITDFEPRLVTAWNLVILRGSGFGTRINNRYRVVTTDGSEVRVLVWTEHKITIVVDPSWDQKGLRVIRPSEYKGVVADRESNEIELEYYLPGTMTDDQRKRYYEQLNNMSDEAKKLYGINVF